VPLVTIGIVAATDKPEPSVAVAPVPALPVPTFPAPQPLPYPPPATCEWHDGPPCFGQVPGDDLDRYRGMNPGRAPSWTPRTPSWTPSRPRPIQPYPAWPGDPNDRDHDGRSCESGCIN
jgi:hypothetical protein